MKNLLLKQLCAQIRNDFVYFALKILKIRSKYHNIEQFVLNKEQIYINKIISQQKKYTGKVKTIILKGRQVGVTTLLAAYNYYWCLTKRGVKSLVLSHKQTSTNNIYGIIKRFYNNSPFFLNHQLVLKKMENTFLKT